MATVDDIARRALGAIGPVDMNGLILAHEWVNNRYAEVCGAVRMRHLRRAGQVTLDAPVTDGTVSIARGDRTVVGTGTAFTPAMVGRFFKATSGWYEVTGVPDATHLTLASAFAESDVTDGGYVLVQRYVVLSPETRYVTSWTLGRRWLPLDTISLRALDELEPSRFYLTTLGAGGGYVAHVGWDQERNGNCYEVYPYSTTSELLNFVYYTKPPRLLETDTLPPTIDEHFLQEGVLIDVYRYMKGKALQAGRADIAGFYRNDEMAQSTKWRGEMMAAIAKADRGADDTEWLIRTVGAPSNRMQEVRTARDHVVVQGVRP